MLVADKENFRFRLDGKLKEEFMEMCEQRKISQQEAISAVIGWIVNADDLMQSMILGQLPATDDLVQIVLRRMSKHRDGQPYRRAAKPRE
jgi:hypothetical protein